MKALVYTAPRNLEYRDEPDPQPVDGEVVVRVQAVGICGSDMHAYLGHDERRPAPLVLGHEAAGVVETGALQGRRVTVNPLVTCGACNACISGRNNLCGRRQILSMQPRAGAFAQLLRIPERNLVAIPDAVSFEKACLAEPLACGWHAVRLARSYDDAALTTGTCLVVGGGAIGLGSALSLHAAGARNIFVSETNALRHQALRDAGPFHVYDPQSGNPIEDGTADVVIDAVGLAATRAAASRLVRPGGVIVHIGLGDSEGGVDVRRLTLHEITLIGAYTYTNQDFQDTAAAIFDGRLGALNWLQNMPLSEGATAFASILSGTASSPKIILNPQ